MGPDTVDTVPPATLDAFIDPGDPGSRLGSDLEGATKADAEFGALGLSLEQVCQGLLADGVKSFTASMTALTNAIDARSK